VIDGISFRLSNEQIKDSDILEFKKNGNRLEAKYRGLRICAYADSTHVTGSIHKYFNNGEHNADDFHLSKFRKALDDLAATLNFNPDCVPFNTFEFGVNVELPFGARTFIDGLVYTRNGTERRDKQGTMIELCEYNIKVYMKSAPDNKNVFRFEIHINKARNIKNKVELQSGDYCRTLSDLKNPSVWRVLGKSLIEIYDTFVFVDTDSLDGVSMDDYKWLCKASNTSYWLREWDSRMSKQRELERLKKIIADHSTNKNNEVVRGLMSEKIQALIDVSTVTFSPTVKNGNVTNSPTVKTELNAEMSQNHQRCKIENDKNTSENSQLFDNGNTPEMLRFHRLDNREICNIFQSGERVCKVTGLSLEIGIKQGAYLSAKGVEFYFKNRPEIFEEKLAPRLQKKWQNSELKIQFREIAHSIRNEIFNPNNNPRNNFKRSIEKRKKGGYGFLFSLAETIRPDKRKLLDEI
jgi:uncharacterized protein YneF (UPF0154 family)